MFDEPASKGESVQGRGAGGDSTGDKADVPVQGGAIALLSNVSRLLELSESLAARPADLPGFGVMDGPSGFGKIFASIYVAHTTRAHCVRLESCTTQRGFCLALIRELGVKAPERTVEGMVHQIADHMAEHPGRPLILDECDHLSRRGIIELVRDIHDRAAPAGASIIMIGETGFYESLKRWERVQSRVLRHMRAQAATLEDVAVLAARICCGIELAPDALERVHKLAAGSARRAVARLYALRDRALSEGRRYAGVELVAEPSDGA